MALCILIFMLLGNGEENPGFLVVVAADSPLESITTRQLRQLYLRKTERISGVRLIPLQLGEGHPVRKRFEERIFPHGFALANYWLEQELQGGEKPPLTVVNEAFVLVYVNRNPGYLGYVHPKLAPELAAHGLTVVRVVD